MANTLNLLLTDDLRAFIDENSGEGTRYATPSDFVLDVLRKYKARREATRVRDAIIEGYHDVIVGRWLPFNGDLQVLVKKPQSLLRPEGRD